MGKNNKSKIIGEFLVALELAKSRMKAHVFNLPRSWYSYDDDGNHKYVQSIWDNYRKYLLENGLTIFQELEFNRKGPFINNRITDEEGNYFRAHDFGFKEKLDDNNLSSAIFEAKKSYILNVLDLPLA